MRAHPTQAVTAFERNCPSVRMTKDEKEELRRLFSVMMDDAQQYGAQEAYAAMKTKLSQ